MTLTSSLKFHVNLSKNAKLVLERDAIISDPGFGKYFTDHMISIDWTKKDKWHNAQVIPYQYLSLSPASAVLHYGQEVFEGLKAFRHADGSIWTFRPEFNALRLQRSAFRLALPELPVETFIESLRQLVQVDYNWVPYIEEASLYLRPFMIANESFLGVRAAEKVAYYVIASPSGPYFSKNNNSISIWLSENYSRAGKGGTGFAKCGGNYAASLLPQKEAIYNGCEQVLFLDSFKNKYLEELGGMNIFLVCENNLILTPSLNGNILEGVTRDSIIRLAKDRNYTVEEKEISIDEWRDGFYSGYIKEAFACGTAAVITPIGQVKSKNFSFGNSNNNSDSLTKILKKDLTDIQYGRKFDRHNWLSRLF